MSYWRYNGNNSIIEEVPVPEAESQITSPGTPRYDTTPRRGIKGKRLRVTKQDVEMMRGWSQENKL